MNTKNFVWTAKVGEKGQIVIPKEARDMFEINPGDSVILLCDKEKGIAVLPKEKQQEVIKQIFSEFEE